MFFWKKTDIYKCKILDRYKINIEKTNRLYLEEHSTEKEFINREYCEIIAESEDYNFYRYLTCSDCIGGFILRQDKNKPKNVVYFGKNRAFNIVFHGYLFQVSYYDLSGFNSSDGMVITARNIVDGELISFNWLSDKYLLRKMIKGHAPSQDTVNDVKIVGSKLVFEVTRQKTGETNSDVYDIDTDYILEVEHNGSGFEATVIFHSVSWW